MPRLLRAAHLALSLDRALVCPCRLSLASRWTTSRPTAFPKRCLAGCCNPRVCLLRHSLKHACNPSSTQQLSKVQSAAKHMLLANSGAYVKAAYTYKTYRHMHTHTQKLACCPQKYSNLRHSRSLLRSFAPATNSQTACIPPERF
jgi:hypothetical protein